MPALDIDSMVADGNPARVWLLDAVVSSGIPRKTLPNKSVPLVEDYLPGGIFQEGIRFWRRPLGGTTKKTALMSALVALGALPAMGDRHLLLQASVSSLTQGFRQAFVIQDDTSQKRAPGEARRALSSFEAGTRILWDAMLPSRPKPFHDTREPPTGRSAYRQGRILLSPRSGMHAP